MHRIELNSRGYRGFSFASKIRQVRITAAIESQLAHEPTAETRNRKRLRPNKLAEWVLRVDTFRVFYDVLPAAAIVKVNAVGVKKGNDLFIQGDRFEL
jgi:hypothetical protein